jgi:ATP-binding cassette subfamily B protein IrtA
MTLMPCTAIAVVPIGGYFYMQGTLAFSNLVMCLILSLGLIAPLITAMSYSDDLAKVSTIIAEVTGILSWEEMSRPETTEHQISDYSISLDQVKFAYHDKEVLHGVTMEIREGTVNALVGPSGSGKSTIAKLIASLWDVGSGSIRIGGTDLREIPPEQFNRLVAYVSQDNYLFNDTIRENIRMGDQNVSDEEVEDAAKRCGCHAFIMGLEHGYDTIVGSAGGHLSGGERQRTAIARAMLKNAPVVILDEATANVDPENEKELMKAIDALTKEKTIIMIAHRLKTVRGADQILVLDHGRIVQKGRHEELMKEDGIYKRFVEARKLAASWRLQQSLPDDASHC